MLKRTKYNIIAGVCGGLANYFGIDAVIVRLIFVLIFCLSSFPILIIYILLWIFMHE